MEHFADVIISHIPKTTNEATNDLAQHASGYKLMTPDFNNIENGIVAIISHRLRASTDWRQELIRYLANTSAHVHFKLKRKVLKYVLIDGELFRRSQEGVLLKYLDKEEAMKVMREVYEGVCGVHKSGSNMK